MGYGLWVMGYGVWVIGYGVWVMGYGLWVVGYGLWGQCRGWPCACPIFFGFRVANSQRPKAPITCGRFLRYANCYCHYMSLHYASYRYCRNCCVNCHYYKSCANRCYTSCATSRWSNCCVSYFPTKSYDLPKRKSCVCYWDGYTMMCYHCCATCLTNCWSSHCVNCPKSRGNNCCANYCPTSYGLPKKSPCCDAPPHHSTLYDCCLMSAPHPQRLM